MEPITKGKYVSVWIPEKNQAQFDGRKHHSDLLKSKQWKKIIFYKKRKPIETNVVDELEIDSCMQYKINTFYKIVSLSQKDKVWSYYRILKDTPHKLIGVKAKQKTPKKHLPSFTKKIYGKSKPYVVEFSK